MYFIQLKSLLKNSKRKDIDQTALARELNLIRETDSAESILKVYDWYINHSVAASFIKACGMTNNSLVNYALGITDINPLKYNLNPELFYLNSNAPTYYFIVSNKDAVDNNFDFNYMEIQNHRFLHWEELNVFEENKIKPGCEFHNEIFKTHNDLELEGEWFFEIQEVIKTFDINSFTDVVNAIPFTKTGLMSFYSNAHLKNKAVKFSELKSANGTILFLDDWINVVARLKNSTIKEANEDRLKLQKDKMSKSEFFSGFLIDDKLTADFLFDIKDNLLSKSHCIGIAQSYCALVNFYSRKLLLN